MQLFLFLCAWYFSVDFEVYFLRFCFAPLYFRISFAQTCHESGLIGDTEWNIYCDWHSFLLEFLQLNFNGFIYFRSTPEVRLVFPPSDINNNVKDVMARKCVVRV